MYPGDTGKPPSGIKYSGSNHHLGGRRRGVPGHRGHGTAAFRRRFCRTGVFTDGIGKGRNFFHGLSYIAMPHGNPALVQRTRLVIGRMKQPLLWDGSRVSCIFLFAISSELLKEKPQLFSTFYRILADPDVEEKSESFRCRNICLMQVFRQKLFQILR